MKNRYYLAYGSNLNVEQMQNRCPGAMILGTATLKGWSLVFKGSKTGAYLTIIPDEEGEVPVAVWKVTEQDELALDRYEGFPTFYYKKEMEVTYRGIKTARAKTVTAFVYLMREDSEFGIPSNRYMRTCMQGYDAFRFNRLVLLEAFNRSMKEVFHED